MSKSTKERPFPPQNSFLKLLRNANKRGRHHKVGQLQVFSAGLRSEDTLLNTASHWKGTWTEMTYNRMSNTLRVVETRLPKREKLKQTPKD